MFCRRPLTLRSTGECQHKEYPTIIGSFQRTQSIAKAALARKEREQTMLGSYPDRQGMPNRIKTFALSAFSMYPIMPFLAEMPR
ncbi:unnamed protein product, partial [Symbiodinium natans]